MKFAHFLLAVLPLAVSNPVPYYHILSPEEAQRLASWTPNSKQSLWELSGQYQGDMVLTPSQRNGIINSGLLWNNRELPYEISSEYTAEEKQLITQALQKHFSQTCIKVRPKTSADRDYAYVTAKHQGCTSFVGRQGGRQDVNLHQNCLRDGTGGTIAHEFLHALGFYHQQSATDRDNYVTIYRQNIIPGLEYAFDKLGPETITSFGQKYDYGSLMHYDTHAFSANGQPTILPKDPNAKIGQRNGLSPTDVVKLHKMYNCA